MTSFTRTTLGLVLIASWLLPAGLHAGEIAWQPVVSITQAADLVAPANATLVEAVNYTSNTNWPGDGMINGIPFTPVTVSPFGLGPSDNPDFWTTATDDPDLDALLDGHAYQGANPGDTALVLTGLDAGRAYQVQLIGAADARTCCSNRSSEVDNGEGIFNTGIVLTRSLGPSVTGVFKASGTTQTIGLRSLGGVPGNPDPGLCGYTLFELPPVEPVIGINFNANDGAGAQAAFNTQGATWTDIVALTGNAVPAAALFEVDWGASNYWQGGSWNDGDGDFSTPADREISLYRVYLDDGDTPNASVPPELGVAGDGIGVAVHLRGMRGWLAATGAAGYHLTVYCSTDQDAASFPAISARAGGTLDAPLMETLSIPVGGNGTFPSATGNLSTGTRGTATFGSFFSADELMLTVPARSGSVRGTLAAVRVSALPLRLVSDVVDGGGGLSDNGRFTVTSAIGQGGPAGMITGSQNTLYSGFLNTFILHPQIDTDGDGIVDENDPDDDGDGLADLGELAGTGFNPQTVTDPLAVDSDMDGSDDGSEAVAGTNPQDPNSLLAILRAWQSVDGEVVEWQSRQGKTYELLRGGSVEELIANPQLIETVTVTGGGQGAFLETTTSSTNAVPTVRSIYRIRIQP